MAFGYALLSGRRGAEGYARQDGRKRRVLIRGLKPNEACALYGLTLDGAALCCRGNADGEGRAELCADRPGALFVEAGGEARLWEGDDGVFLRAAAFLSSLPENPDENKREDEEKAKIVDLPSEAANAEEAQAAPEMERREAAKIPRDASPAGKEPAYTLRAPGSGEPVDTLPERD